MSCGSCCKAFWFKIMYIILLGAFFVAAMAVCWNVYDTARFLNADMLDSKVQLQTFVFNKQNTTVTTQLFGIPLVDCQVSTLQKNSVCAALPTQTVSICYKLKDNYKLTINNRFEWNATATVDYATKEFMQAPVNGNISLWSMIGGIATIVIGGITILCIIFCCTGCCTCCCCSKSTSGTTSFQYTRV